MNNRLQLAFIGLLFLNALTYAQPLESRLQALIDSIYTANPASIGIMIHVESPNRRLSYSGSAGYANAKEKTELMPDQPALIASSIKPYISATILRLQELGKLSIEDPVRDRLSKETVALFESDGYAMDRIKIKNLLSHTSGIEGYDKMEFLDWIGDNPSFRWSRDELLGQAVKMGDPLGNPEDVYNYADANYLLCTEIIEVVTNKPFYVSIRELLNYDEFDFDDTWFPTLEEQSKTTKPLIHQYWGEKNWDSHNIDISWDLYGGGGIATTTEEISQFYYHLFTGRIIEDESTFNQIFTEVKTKDGKERHGSQEDYRVFMPQLELLGKEFRVITYSRRYNYPNDQVYTAGTPFNPMTEAEDLEKLRQEIGIEKIHVVGHSYGGLIALAYANQYQDRLESLTISEPPILNIEGCKESLATTETGLIEKLRASFRTKDTSVVMKAIFEFFVGEDIQNSIPPEALQALISNLSEMEALSNSQNPFPKLNTVFDLPNMIITSEYVMPNLMCTNESLIRTTPDAKHVKIMGASHDMWITHPDVLSRHLREFIVGG